MTSFAKTSAYSANFAGARPGGTIIMKCSTGAFACTRCVPAAGDGPGTSSPACILACNINTNAAPAARLFMMSEPTPRISPVLPSQWDAAAYDALTAFPSGRDFVLARWRTGGVQLLDILVAGGCYMLAARSR
jgi:hypothetical protein